MTCCLPDSPISRKTLSISIVMEITEQETLPVYPLVTLRFIFLPSYGYRFSFFWNLIQMIKSDRRDYVYALNLVPTQQHCGSCVCDFQLSAREQSPSQLCAPSQLPGSGCWTILLSLKQNSIHNFLINVYKRYLLVIVLWDILQMLHNILEQSAAPSLKLQTLQNPLNSLTLPTF